jgi:SulP family sulfate permease
MTISLYTDLKQYSFKKLSSDLIAGLTVAIILIPQGMAYSLLAGLAPIYGLYAALVPLLIYPFFSSSRYLSIGPVALMSIIVLGGVSTLAEPGSPEYLSLVIFSSFLAGLMQISFSLLKLGNLTSFLSKPVMSGFISAAGVIIAISQLKYLFSLQLPRRISIVQMVIDILEGISLLNWISFALGIGSIFIIIALKKVHRAIPSALLVVIIGSLLVMSLNLVDSGVPIIGDMPKGLPSFDWQFLSLNKVISLLPTALIIALIGFVGSYSISSTLGTNEEQQGVNPNKELFALGAAKLIGSFFSAMPSTGSFTRSAINQDVGAKTQIASIVAGLVLMVTLIFLGGLFYYLPEPILAGIVITSVFSLIDIKYAKSLFKVDRRDFAVLMITFLATLLFGITNGVIIGVLASFFDVMYRTSTSFYAIVGKLPNTNVYRNIDRYSDAQSHDKILIFRFSQNLYFANARMIIKALEKEIENYPNVEYIVISFPTNAVPDATATYYLFRLIDFCRDRDLRLVFTDLTGPVRDLMKKTGFADTLGKNNFFLVVEDAVDAIENGDVRQIKSIDYSSQNNYDLQNKTGLGRFWE